MDRSAASAHHFVAYLRAAVVRVLAASLLRPPPESRRLLIASVTLVTIRIAVAGTSSVRAVWLVALLGIAVGVGAGNTGSTGVLLDVVPPDRIVLAMVVWSQVGIVGYLVGPLLGGVLAEAPGSRTLGLIPAIIGALLVVQLGRLTLASSR